MADKDKLHRCVTQFMLDTCSYTSTSGHAATVSSFYNRLFSRRFHTRPIAGSVETFLSGSSAEFYITPALSCIGDTDVMVCLNYSLVIPAGFTPSTELPPHFRHIVYVFEIIDSDQPGYVYLPLQPSYIIKKNDEGRYVVEKIANSKIKLFPRINDLAVNNQRERTYRNTNMHKFGQYHCDLHFPQPSFATHGPAIQQTFFEYVALQEFADCKKANNFINWLNLFSNCDIVLCVRCLLWPPQAAEWPKRCRNQGWPNYATVSNVVIKGCDVVQAVHPSYKQDEWASRYQWRLSFSRAEVTLLNSWTPVQQVIYHMLRFVLKHEVFSKTNESSSDMPKLSNYHVKTLMLWECEQKLQTWWSAESSLVRLCNSLLQKLCDWVSNRICQHYFVIKCNLLDYFTVDTLVVIRNSLRKLADASVLVYWFVDNYIYKCAQCYHHEVQALFEYFRSTGNLEAAVNVVADWKLAMMPFERYKKYWMEFELMILWRLQSYRINCLMALLHMNNGERSPDYTIAAASLRIALTISTHGLSERLLEVLWSFFAPYAAAIIISNPLELLRNELSKAYLQYFVSYGVVSTYCVVHVLLAVLNYNSLHYQKAIDHCKQVLNINQGDCKQDNVHTIGAECLLPHVDGLADTVFGLIVLYQHVRGSAYSCYEQSQLASMSRPVLTIELLAQYLYLQCSLAISAKGDKITTMYRQHFLQSKRLYVGDILLFKAAVELELQVNKCTNMPVVKVRTATTENKGSGSVETTLLVAMLEQVALEKLIAVRQQTIRELSSDQFPLVNEFEVLYIYKCGLIEECLEICRRNVSRFLCAVLIPCQPYLVAFPELLSLLDDELVSLFGIMEILHPITFSILITLKLQPTAIANRLTISTLTFSLYLMVQCMRKLCIDPSLQQLQLIRYVHDRVFPGVSFVLDRLVLKLSYRLLKQHAWSIKSRRD